VNGRFRIGSVTKTFVATVILQLAAERRLSLADPVSRHLPGLVPNGENITVRQLLNHTSGIYDYTRSWPPTAEHFLAIRFDKFPVLDLVKIGTSQPPLFPPGTDWSYSNTNYLLAGLIIEKVTGRPYGEAVQRRILWPLGLRDTFVPGTRIRIPGPHARGYLPVGTPPQPVDVTELNPALASSAGEMISTTADVNRFFAALLGGRLLRPAQLAEMKDAVTVEPGFRYGLGLVERTWACGARTWGHGGGIPGYVTLAENSADGRTQLAVSLNPLNNPEQVGRAVIALAEKAFCGTAPPTAGEPGERARAELPLLPAQRGSLT
jgi:D-alanyl-D-alanine carboxypeptidase